MEKENISWSDEEELRAENDFLKMKLMLENGAEFHGSPGSLMPPEIENRFLRNIAAFEEHWAQQKMITVFEKIGAPKHFEPVNLISEDEIEDRWRNLWEYLHEKGIHVEHCSPRVTARELYRFTTEELFQQEIEDIAVPGLMRGFIYDEFHPDPSFDLCILVENLLFWNIFQKGETRQHSLFKHPRLVINEQPPIAGDLFIKRIEDFKDHFVELNLKNYRVFRSEIIGDNAELEGNYSAEGLTTSDLKIFEGNFLVKLEKMGEEWVLVELIMENWRLF